MKDRPQRPGKKDFRPRERSEGKPRFDKRDNRRADAPQSKRPSRPKTAWAPNFTAHDDASHDAPFEKRRKPGFKSRGADRPRQERAHQDRPHSDRPGSYRRDDRRPDTAKSQKWSSRPKTARSPDFTAHDDASHDAPFEKRRKPGFKSQKETRSADRPRSDRPGSYRRDDRPNDRRDDRRDARRDNAKRKPDFFSADSGARRESFSERPAARKPYGKSFGKPFAKPERKPRAQEAPRETFRAAPDAVLIWGVHAARAAWLNPARKIHRAWMTESGKKTFDATQSEARDALLKRPDARQVDRTELDRMTPPGSVHQGIVIEAAPLPDRTLQDVIAANPPPDVILVLDQVTDPHNVGAILRSAAAFGAGAIVMTERNAPTTTGVLAKSASGALEHTPMLHVVNLSRALDDLREAGYWCVGLAEEGEKTLGELDMSGRTVLVLGNEGDGLRHLTRQKCDELARLPTGGPIGSLNVSNAAAVALYEARRQTKKA